MQGQSPNWIGKGANEGAKYKESDVLEEVDLATLGTIEVEPVSIWEFLGIVAIARVRVAELRGILLAWESLAVDLVELLHELPVEDFDASAHRHSVDGDQILDYDGHGEDQTPKHLLGNLVLALRDANDLHLSFCFY